LSKLVNLPNKGFFNQLSSFPLNHFSAISFVSLHNFLISAFANIISGSFSNSGYKFFPLNVGNDGIISDFSSHSQQCIPEKVCNNCCQKTQPETFLSHNLSGHISIIFSIIENDKKN
jgi:hypothetical protein